MSETIDIRHTRAHARLEASEAPASPPRRDASAHADIGFPDGSHAELPRFAMGTLPSGMPPLVPGDRERVRLDALGVAARDLLLRHEWPAPGALAPPPAPDVRAPALELSNPVAPALTPAAETSRPDMLRVDAIDVVRGVMMIAITCVHGLNNLAPGHGRMHAVLNVLLSATVGFTTVSGLLVGWFAVVKRARYDRVSRRYAVQAARLLLIVHPLLALTMFAHGSFSDVALRTLFITDTLAVLFLVVVPVVPRISARTRLAIGIAMIVMARALGLVMDVPAIRLIHELMCGVDPSQQHVLVSSYGLLPLGGMFFIGTWLGEHLAHARANSIERAFAATMVRWAIRLIAAGVALVGMWGVVRFLGHHDAARVLYPDYESALYPIYFGTTLLWLVLAMRFDPKRALLRVLALLGKTSLFVYVAQYVLVETTPELIGWHGVMPPLAWVALCAGSIPLLVGASTLWRRWFSPCQSPSATAPAPRTPTAPAGVDRPPAILCHFGSSS